MYSLVNLLIKLSMLQSA